MKNCLLAVLLMLATLNASACKVPVFSLEQQVEKAEEIFIANLREAKVMPVDNHHKWPWIQGRFEVKKLLKAECNLRKSHSQRAWGVATAG